VLIAGELRHFLKDRLCIPNIAQENELADGKRPDILMQYQNINAVPVELKLLDKGWSGLKLVERLENQLVNSYLRENNSQYGIFLLVWAGKKVKGKKWTINGKKFGVDDLEDVLYKHWKTIENKHPSVSDIKVVVIDLTKRFGA